jgi:hypothetical protein
VRGCVRACVACVRGVRACIVGGSVGESECYARAGQGARGRKKGSGIPNHTLLPALHHTRHCLPAPGTCVGTGVAVARGKRVLGLRGARARGTNTHTHTRTAQAGAREGGLRDAAAKDALRCCQDDGPLGGHARHGGVDGEVLVPVHKGEAGGRLLAARNEVLDLHWRGGGRQEQLLVGIGVRGSVACVVVTSA